MAADGSIVIQADVDDKKAQAELNRLAKKIDDLNAKIKQAETDRLPWLEQAQELGVKLDEAKAKFEAMQTAPAGYTSEQIAEQAETVKSLQAQWDAAQKKVEGYDRAIETSTSELNSVEGRAGALAEQLSGAGDAGRNAGNQISSAMEAAQKRMEKFEKRIIGLAKRVFVFTLITKALRSLKDYLWENIQTSEEAQAAIAKLRGALLTLAQPLVNVIIPAFTKLAEILSKLTSVIANIISKIFGQTTETTVSQAEASKEARNALKGESKALKDSAKAAKEAEKQFARFDEIQQIVSNNAEDMTDALDIDFEETNAPDYSDVFEAGNWLDDLLSSIQDKFGDFLSSLKLSFDDVILDWHDLTGEQIAEKIIAGLTTLAGAVIGFSIGGIPGAIIGAFAGCALGLVFDSLLFDHDGQLSAEEILKMIITAAGALVGGILGFVTGGPAGAALGVLLGGYLGVTLSNLIFDGDGKVSSEEIIKMIVSAASAIAGGVLGFAAGGPAGAALGVLIGAGLGITLNGIIFNDDGKVSGNEIVKALLSALSVIAGGVIGFAFGGPFGAIVGMALGVGLTFALSGIDWSAVEKAFSDLVNGVKKAWGNITKFLADTWKNIRDGVREAWNGIWSIIKGVINMILEGVETFINGIISIINAVLGAISAVASVFSSLLGFGKVDLRISPVHIPRLAAGAVIPPNREFLAVLGDQSSGNNIEAPESLLRQMAQEAASANTELLREILNAIRAGHTIEVDRMPFGRVVRDAYNSETARTGASFVKVT